jgi:hypothetical protein
MVKLFQPLRIHKKVLVKILSILSKVKVFNFDLSTPMYTALKFLREPNRILKENFTFRWTKLPVGSTNGMRHKPVIKPPNMEWNHIVTSYTVFLTHLMPPELTIAS